MALLPLAQAGFAPAAGAATGRQLSVAPWGSDSAAGTADAPFATIQHAMDQLEAGDTLTVRGGTYPERVVMSYSSITPGTATAPITVQAHPGERPVIQGRLRLSGADHWTIRGINVTWSDANTSSEHMVVFRGGTNWRFTDAEVWGARSYAAIVVGDGARDFSLDHLYVHHTYPANNLNQDHLIYIGSGNTGGIVERNILAHSENGRGVKVGPGSLTQPGSDGLVIRHNTFYNNTGPSNIRFSGDSSDNQVYGNLMVKPKADLAAVTAYELTGTNNTVHHNAAWESDGIVDPTPGLVDTGDNVMVDPAFADPANGDYTPTNPAAANYGAHAPGDTTDGTGDGTTDGGTVGDGTVTSTVTVTASADAHIISGDSNNHGSLDHVRVRNYQPPYRGYVRFDVAGMSTVESATLRLWVTDGSNDTGALHAVASDWQEGTINWSNAPAPVEPPLLAGTGATAGTWAEFDVTGVVTGDGAWSFALVSASNNSVFYSSREGSQPPQLVVTGASTSDGTDSGTTDGGTNEPRPDTAAPEAPTGLEATAGDALVQLDWADNAETDLAGYHVYRSTTAGSGHVRLTGAPVTTSALEDSGLANGTRYHYVVTALDATGNESPVSTEVSATPQAPLVDISPVVVSERYDHFGGKSNDNHLDVHLTVAEGSTPLAGKLVAIALHRNGSLMTLDSATTDSAGYVAFKYRSVGAGCYSATVTSITGVSLYEESTATSCG